MKQRLPPLQPYNGRKVFFLVLCVVFVASLILLVLTRRELDKFRKHRWYQAPPTGR